MFGKYFKLQSVQVNQHQLYETIQTLIQLFDEDSKQHIQWRV